MNDTNKTSTNKLLYVSIHPHIKDKDTVSYIMLYVIVSLIPPLIAGTLYFGAYSILLTIVCIATAILSETIFCLLFKIKLSIKDLSSVITGLLLALSLPPKLPLWIAAIGAFFSVIFGKMVFGGLGQNFMNPALCGRAFLMISFPTAMTTFIPPLYGTINGLQSSLDGISSATPLEYFKSAINSNSFNALDLQDALFNIFIGNVGGCMGATSGLAILLGVFFLLYKGIIRIKTPLFFILTVFLMFLFFNNNGDILSTESLIEATYQVLSGGTLLGAFYFASDPVTIPITPLGRIIFGIGCGFFTFIFRKFSIYTDGVCWAILIMNIITPIIERVTIPRYLGKTKND
jgi:electron transport complex protein RnfD